MDYTFRTEYLPQIREALESAAQLGYVLGSLARFELVIDANILISDVLWHVGKRRRPDSKSALLECIIAGTIRAYITPEVAEEVERWLPTVALDRGLSTEECVLQWEAYKRLINIR